MVRSSETGSRGKGNRSFRAHPAGNLPNAKGVGCGVFEFRIDFGPGYRIYFGKDGKQLVILVGGGTKKCQQQDITLALAGWQDYKQRKTIKR